MKKTIQSHAPKNRDRTRGYLSVSMAIMLTVAAIITTASARMSIDTAIEKKGTSIGTQLQTLSDALNAYIIQNNVNLTSIASRNTAVSLTDVATPPTITQLKSGGFLQTGYLETPALPGAYAIKIIVNHKIPQIPQTTACTLECNITGLVYIDTPITTLAGDVDLKLIGSAVDASTGNNIGYSSKYNPDKIYSKGGQIANNPNPQNQPGILLATTAISNSNGTDYWLKPVSNTASLPTSGNSNGDGRFTLDNYKPLVWGNHTSATVQSWQELYTNAKTQSVSIGNNSAKIINFATPYTNPLSSVYIGYEAGKSSTPNGTSTVSIGAFSGTKNAGLANTFLGASAGINNSSGWYNTFLGGTTGFKNSTGSNNTFVGYGTGSNNTASSNTFVGFTSGQGNTTGAFNSSLGFYSGKSNTTGSNNVNIGSYAGLDNLTGSNAVNIGTSAGRSNLSDENIYIGNKAGYSTTGTFNTYVGAYTGYNTVNVSNNTIVGHNASIFAITGSHSTIVGSQAGLSNNGNRNTLIGYKSGPSLNLAGASNTFIGAESGRIAIGASNTFVGDDSGYGMMGNNNVSIGTASGFNVPSNFGATGNNNTIIGVNAKTLSGANNSIAIGAGSYVAESNKVRIGNTSIIEIGGEVPWSNLSDRRAKIDIKKSDRGLKFINSLEPVDYTLISNGMKQTGFIAQDVEMADTDFPGVRKPKNKEDLYSLTYTDFIPSIVKSIQELDQKILDKIQVSTNESVSFTLLQITCSLLAISATVLLIMMLKMRRRMSALEETFKTLIPSQLVS